MGTPLRLSPTMTSRKLQALDFIKQYIVRWNASPSYDEIAAELGTNGARVHAIVRQLVTEGHIRRQPGQRRGILLPDHESEALRVLRQAGWKVLDDTVTVRNPRLPRVPELDHILDVDIGGGPHDRDQSG